MPPQTPVSTSPGKGEVGRAAAGRGSRFSRTSAMTSRARRLRGNMTDAEYKLWHALRRDQLGFSFRRQHPIGPYTLDFYCPALRLAIEVDGGQHAEQTRQADARRTAWLAAKGIGVFRIWNNDVFGNLEGVLTELMRVVGERAKLPPSPTLPLPGGGSGQTAAGGGIGQNVPRRTTSKRTTWETSS